MIPHRNDACMCHHDACLSIMSDLNNCNGTLPTAITRQLRSPQSDPLSESSSLIFLGKHLLRLHHHHQSCGLCTFQLWHSNLLASWWLCPQISAPAISLCPKMVTNRFGNRNFMQLMKAQQALVMDPVFYFWGWGGRSYVFCFSSLFPMCSYHVPLRFPKFPICSLRRSQ
jgi:hypothetical protein